MDDGALKIPNGGAPWGRKKAPTKAALFPNEDAGDSVVLMPCAGGVVLDTAPAAWGVA
jgi:hypothetical protein